jgi:hypothetical protein
VQGELREVEAPTADKGREQVYRQLRDSGRKTEYTHIRHIGSRTPEHKRESKEERFDRLHMAALNGWDRIASKKPKPERMSDAAFKASRMLDKLMGEE